MQQPAPRVKAARNSGVQADGLRTCKERQALEIMAPSSRAQEDMGFTKAQLSYCRLAEVLARIEVHNKHVGRLHQFFLDARRRNEDMVMMSDTCSATSTSYLCSDTLLAM